MYVDVPAKASHLLVLQHSSSVASREPAHAHAAEPYLPSMDADSSGESPAGKVQACPPSTYEAGVFSRQLSKVPNVVADLLQ